MIKYFKTIGNKDSPNFPSPLQWGFYSILIVVALLLAVKNYNSFQLGIYMDDASYAILAQSLVSSDEYGLINAPGKPQPTRYPFGFPLLLSPFPRFFPDHPDLMKLVSLFATLLNALLLFLGWPHLSQSKSYWWGLIVAALYVTSPLVVSHTRMVMSEPAFTTFVLMALILTEKQMSRDSTSTQAFLLGMIAAFALFTQSVGVVLWIAIVIRGLLTLSMNKMLKWLGSLFAGGMAFVLLVIISTPVDFVDLVPSEYVDQFQTPQSWEQTQIETPLVPRFVSACIEYTKQHVREAIVPLGGGEREQKFGERLGIHDFPSLIGLVVSVLVLLGFFHLLCVSDYPQQFTYSKSCI